MRILIPRGFTLATAVAVSLGVVSALGCPQAAQAGSADHYVPAITNPVLNESPYITTEVRAFYMYNRIPRDFALGKGQLNLYAVQLRAALSDRLALIATKDGYAQIHFKNGIEDSGFANLAAGLKYAVVADESSHTYLSVGGRYEAPSGSLEVVGIDLQGTGDGLIDVFVSGATVLEHGTGLQASMGFNVALDQDNDSSLFHSSLHADQELLTGLYGVLELNLVTTIEDGSRTTGAGSFEGVDLANFGNSNSGTVVSLGVGSRYQLNDHLQCGLAFEFPLTDREDILGDRLTFDVIYRL